MPPKTLVRVGLWAILLALVVSIGSGYWLATRTFVPVSMPVSLETGKVQSVDFELNLREDYIVSLTADSIDDWTEGKCKSRALSDADWKIYRLSTKPVQVKELWASSEEMKLEGSVPIGFRGLPGKYKLEWSVPDTALCLNARHPELRVWADSDSYVSSFRFVLLVSLLVVMAGVGAILRAIVIRLQVAPGNARALRIFPDMILTNAIPLRRHRPMPLITVLPDFRTAWFCVIGILTVLFCLFLTNWTWHSKGLGVDFKGERTVIVGKNPWTETMAVNIDAKRRFRLNGKEVAREELRSELESELSRRGVWVVYFEADDNCLYMDAVYAIDTIQALGAKLIWITPKTREAWKQRATPKM